MYVLIRRLGGRLRNRTYQDEELLVDRLTLGRGTDQDVLLPGDTIDLKHIEISLSAGRLQLRAMNADGVQVNGRITRSTVLNVGDQVLVGDYRLVVIEPPSADVDVALSLEVLQAQGSVPLDPERFTTSLERVRWLRPRGWAWALFVVVLGVALVLPALVTQKPEMADTLRQTPLPDDHWWLSGPLHSVHAGLANECEACHVTPFVQVANDACESCHEQMPGHLPATHLANELMGTHECASCHSEHNEQASIIAQDQRYCAGCHNLVGHALGELASVAQVSDFSVDHPAFRVSLLEPRGDAPRMQWQQSGRLSAATAAERSNLAFDHALHLDPAGIDGAMGEAVVMQCADCHQVGLDGDNMVPVSMEQHCQSCHSLAFDTDAPERTLPHGQPEQVLDSLREYFSRRFVEDREASHGRARPGDREAVQRLRAEGLDWVEKKSMAVAADMFERRACATCHDVERVTGDDGEPRWLVTPVRLNSHWFLSARFDHVRHEQMECADCHAAAQSESSADVLMPEIEQCTDCHAGSDGMETGKLESTCTLCHSYHQAPLSAVKEMQP